MIVMGSLYLEACPVAVNIPIYLIVGGLVHVHGRSMKAY